MRIPPCRLSNHLNSRLVWCSCNCSTFGTYPSPWHDQNCSTFGTYPSPWHDQSVITAVHLRVSYLVIPSWIFLAMWSLDCSNKVWRTSSQCHLVFFFMSSLNGAGLHNSWKLDFPEPSMTSYLLYFLGLGSSWWRQHVPIMVLLHSWRFLPQSTSSFPYKNFSGFTTIPFFPTNVVWKLPPSLWHRVVYRQLLVWCSLFPFVTSA